MISKLKNVSPIEQYYDREQFLATELNRFFDKGILIILIQKIFFHFTGLESISRGKLAVITLAGGQASRLGSSLPKGIINLGTGLGAENDSLLFLQACQISYLQKKAKGRIIWLIMTSKSTDAKIREHLDIILKKTNLDWKNV